MRTRKTRKIKWFNFLLLFFLPYEYVFEHALNFSTASGLHKDLSDPKSITCFFRNTFMKTN